jgi:hypothetical protein
MPATLNRVDGYGMIDSMPLPPFDVVLAPLFDLLGRHPAGLRRGEAVAKLSVEFP